jgi:8-oxo-dGTP pyrophosphatase MutT (NUDIX family)
MMGDMSPNYKSSRRKSLAKVVAFVTRDQESDKQLLLIHHPTAGIQLPAGTVNLGEPLEEAVLRETVEETALECLQIIRGLGSISEELPSGRRIILRATKIFNEPSFDASSEGFALSRGSTVTVSGQVGSFSAIIGEPLDHRQDPPRRVSDVTGFVRSSLLGTNVERHFFHLATTTATLDCWEVDANGQVFMLNWTSLKSRPALVAPQRKWLDQVYPSLTSP